jgi:hypothetical protein
MYTKKLRNRYGYLTYEQILYEGKHEFYKKPVGKMKQTIINLLIIDLTNTKNTKK